MLALIPARKGSKGLPGKNIRKLGGKPLIAHTIEAALQSDIFSRVVVSTDDEEIRDVSLNAGAEAPFLRPAELATDDATSIDVVLHALGWLADNQGFHSECLALLQPTSPFRDAEDIKSAWTLFQEKSAMRLVSVVESEKHPDLMFSVLEERLVPLRGDYNFPHRRQDYKQVYAPNGALYIGQTAVIANERSFYGPDTVAFIMPKLKSVDVDDLLDFLLAETIVAHGLLRPEKVE